jgi:hypothetical protein
VRFDEARMKHNLPQELATEAAKALPPATVTATTIAGVIDWQTWVLVLTAMYLVLQITWLIWRFIDKAHGKTTND